MHLLLPLASILGLELDDLLARLRRDAAAWAAISLLLLVAVAFLLVAGHNALAELLGPVLAPLLIAGLALLIALVVYVVGRSRRVAAQRREATRRHSTERTAMVTTAAMSAVPLLIKSPLVRKFGLPVGAAVAAAFFLSRLSRATRPRGGPDLT